MRRYTPSIQLLPSTLAAFALYSATATAQDSTLPATPPEVEAPDTTTEALPPAPVAEEESAAPVSPALPGEEAVAAPVAEQEETEDGMRLTDAALNSVFEVLARDAGLSYFHNNRIAGEDFKVNGYLKDGDPVTQMEDLAFNNALTLHRKGNTIYALTSDQLNQLPATEWTYQLRYLRSENMKEHIRELVSPLLSPNTGIVNYEEKTNTLVVIDTPHKIQRVQSLLERIDKAKGQIVVEVQILKVNQTVAQNLGVNWEQFLGGGDGVTNPSATLQLGSLLGLPGTPRTGGDLVFNGSTIEGVIRALNDGGVTEVINKPVVITEDNEPASITVIDRIPIITLSSSGSSSSAGSNPTVDVEVRYKIDEEDSTDPETTREIGTTISVTPTLLPDGTIRLKMRPRTASVVKDIQVEGTGFNQSYPQVQESSLTTIARIPDGHSLVIGGFYSTKVDESGNKVPLLGDIPGINFFFKNKETAKEKSNLIFIVTPSSYNPAQHSSHHRTHNRVKCNLTLKPRETTFDHQGNDNLNETDMRRTWNNIKRETNLDELPKLKNSNGSNSRYRVHR